METVTLHLRPAQILASDILQTPIIQFGRSLTGAGNQGLIPAGRRLTFQVTAGPAGISLICAQSPRQPYAHASQR